LYNHVYTNSAAKAEVGRVHSLITALYHHFSEHFGEMPPEFRANPRHEPNERIVVDYIAGMTDHYAIETFERIYVPRLWSR
jgi:dGTPase